MENPVHKQDAPHAPLAEPRKARRLGAAYLETLTSAQQLKLYGASHNHPELTPESLHKYASLDGAVPVLHGRTSLSGLTRFQLHLFRSPDGKIYGRTETPIAPFLGPGYFCVHNDTSGRGSLVMR